jgi:ubiquinone/menaquinone biosynthesis C-methylase UbiE
MGYHTFPLDNADALEDPTRFRFCSREELLALIDPSPTAVVADLGSGTGFYTDEVAPFVDRVHAVDVQEGMHDIYREKGLPENVDTVTAEVADLPLPGDTVDAAYSTMTYHEYAGEDALAEIDRVLRPGGVHVVVDWTAEGPGESGPPTDERFSLAAALDHHRAAGFRVEEARTRPETFALAARTPVESESEGDGD